MWVGIRLQKPLLLTVDIGKTSSYKVIKYPLHIYREAGIIIYASANFL